MYLTYKIEHTSDVTRTFTRVSSVKIKKNLREIPVYSAEINIPISLYDSADEYISKSGIYKGDKLKRGDKIVIWLGYNTTGLNKEFEGVIEEVLLKDRMLTLVCVDEFIKLKYWYPPSFKLKSPTLFTLMSKYIEGSGVRLDTSNSSGIDITLYDHTYLGGKRAINLVRDLRSVFYTILTVKDNVMSINLPTTYFQDKGETVYSFSQNVESESLKWQHEQSENTIVIIEDKDGKVIGKAGYVKNEKGIDEVTNLKPLDHTAPKATKLITVVNKSIRKLKDANELSKRLCKREKVKGYQGTFTTWLYPFVDVGYRVKIKDGDYTSSYDLERMEIEFGPNTGGKRTLYIGKTN